MMTINEFDRRLVGRSGALAIAGLTLVLITTLFPYDLAFRKATAAFGFDLLLPSVWQPELLIDLPANVLLYIPIAFGLTGLLGHWYRRRLISCLLIVTVLSVLSLGVELLQTQLPTRSPSILDVAANGLGGLAGCLIFLFGGAEYLTGVHRTLNRIMEPSYSKRLGLCLAAYLILLAVVCMALYPKTSLGNWAEEYPLLVGNERTGDRSWCGSVSDLVIASSVLSMTELGDIEAGRIPRSTSRELVVAHYGLQSDMGLTDRMSSSPPLIRRTDLTEKLGESEPGSQHQDRQAWLESELPPMALIQATKHSSRFTVSALVQTDNVAQFGPARIISLSTSIFERNFTIGQEGSDLVIRLRTPLTGLNGSNPQLVIPEIFGDSKAHRIIVTYDGESLAVYVDGIRQSAELSLNPLSVAVGFFQPISACNLYGYKLLYLGIIFCPVGMFLAFTLRSPKKLSWLRKAAMIASSLILFPLLWEIFVTLAGHQKFSWWGFGSGALTVFASMLFGLLVSRLWSSSHAPE